MPIYFTLLGFLQSKDLTNSSEHPKTVENYGIMAATSVDAIDDVLSASCGGVTTSVLINDIADGNPVNASSVTINSPNIPTDFTINADGTITVGAIVAPGAYTFNYTICDVDNTSVCDIATVTVNIQCTNPEPFICDETAYLIASTSPEPSVLNLHNAQNGDDLGVDIQLDYVINGMGFNVADNLIYGLISQREPNPLPANPIDPGTLVVIDANGDVYNKGIPVSSEPMADRSMPVWQMPNAPLDEEVGILVAVGTVDYSGNFYTIAENKVNGNTERYLVKVNLETMTYVDYDLSLDKEMWDFAFSPTDNRLYGLHRGEIIRVNPNNGNQTVMSPLGWDIATNETTAGGAWSNLTGNIFFYDNNSTGGPFLRYNVPNNRVRKLGDSERYLDFDATACFPTTFEKEVINPPTEVVPGETITYKFTVTNGTTQTIIADFIDDLSDGMTWVENSVTPNPPGNGTVSFNGQVLTISDMEIPTVVASGGTTFSFTVQATINYPAQAAPCLHNSATLTAGAYVLTSDDPNTAEVGDETVICLDLCDASLTGYLDSDGDNITDICDIDDDNDGVLDEVECSNPAYNALEGLTASSTGVNLTNLKAGDVLVKSNIFTVDGQAYDALITLEKVSISSGTLQVNSGILEMVDADADVEPYVVYSLALVKNGTTTPVYFPYLSMELRDVDGDISSLIEEVGYESAVAPYYFQIGENLKQSNFDFSTTTKFEQISNIRSQIPASSDNITHWLGLIYNDYTTSKFFFGLRPNYKTNLYTRQIYHYILIPCDVDKDGVPNHRDLDSDGDNCLDITEAGVKEYLENNNLTSILVSGNVVNGNGTNTSSNTTTSTNGARVNINNGGDSVGSGNGFHDVLESTSAGVYVSSYTDLNLYHSNILRSNCICYKDAGTGSSLSSVVGISTLNRSHKANSTDWPLNVSSGYLVLDSKEKGFVITSLTSDQISTIDAQEGMLIYDTVKKCLVLYNDVEWHCLEQTCND